MKKVEKVSIGNIAFTLESEAHRILEDYLFSMEEHYASDPNGGEIMAGIEERIAELFTDRECTDRIVSVQVVNEVIALLGKPEDLDDGERAPSGSRKKSFGGRRLYRDIDNRYVGGVISGFASYFNLDVVWLRVIYLLLLVLLSPLDIFFRNGPFGLFLVLVYVVFWIAMPAAVTSDQKRELRGRAASVSGIQEEVSNPGRRRRTVRKKAPGLKAVTDMLKIVVGSLFLITGLAGIVLVVLFFLGVTAVGPLFNWGLADLIVPITGFAPWVMVLFKASFSLMLTLPFIGLLYGGVMMMFRLRVPGWHPGLVLLVLWIVAAVTFSTVSLCGFRTLCFGTSVSRENIEILSGDTLYLEFVGSERYRDEKVALKASEDEYSLVYFSDVLSDPSFHIYPKVSLSRFSGNGTGRMEVRSVRFDGNTSRPDSSDGNETGALPEISGRHIRLNPMMIDRHSCSREMIPHVKLYVDENTVVIVDKPIHHEFNGDFEYFDFFLDD